MAWERLSTFPIPRRSNDPADLALYGSHATMAAVLLAADGGEGKAPAKPPHTTPTIPLSTKLRFVIRPTLLGLVPPDDPQDFGEVLVRVVSITGDALGLRYEIKERVQKAVPLAALPTAGAPAGDAQTKSPLLPERSRRRPVQDAAPALTKLVDVTRIRRGLITAACSAAVHRVDLPLFWDDGDWQTDSGLLWLSRAAYSELKTSGSTAWEPGCAAVGGLARAGELKRMIAKREAAAGASPAAPVRLVVSGPETHYPCIVNGERADLPALLAQDSLGLAQCWILADPNNPLVLKLTYLPQDHAAAEVTAAPAAPAEATAAAASATEAKDATENQRTSSTAGNNPSRKRLLPERKRPHSQPRRRSPDQRAQKQLRTHHRI